MTRIAPPQDETLELVVLASLTAAFLLLLLPWLWGITSPPIPALALTLACWGVAYKSLWWLVERKAGPAGRRIGATFLQGGTVLTLSWVWHLSGGVSNPVFLWVFVPILLAQALLRPGWGPYGIAALSWLGVSIIALSESEALGWQAYRAGIPITGLGKLIRLAGAASTRGDAEPSSHFMLDLILFAGGSLGVVVLGDVLSGRLGRAIPLSLGSDSESRDDFFRRLIEQDPLPRVVVNPQSGAILHMSESFRRQMLVDGAPRTIFEVVGFDDAAGPRLLLSGGSAEVVNCRYRIGPELREGRLRAHGIISERGALVSLTFEEILVALRTEHGPAAAGAEDPS